ncbi:unnamed protein product [Discula destructiva]
MSSKRTTTKAEAPSKRQPKRQTRRKPVYSADSGGDELGDEIQVSPCDSKRSIPAKRNRADSLTKTSSKPTPKPAAKRSKPTLIRGARRWEPDFVTHSPKSPLVTGGVDLRTLLLQPAAWDVLSAEDKQEILALMPSNTHILDANTPDARPNIGSLRNNDTFRHDAEGYVSSMAKGMHDPQWLKDAWAAHQRRAVGDFDEFYIRKIEVDWSTDIPDEHRPEHLRAKKQTRPSASGDESMADAPESRRCASEHNSVSVESGDSEPGGAVKDEHVSSSNGVNTETSNSKTSNEAAGVADSITVRAEKASKSHGEARFEVILDDVAIDKAAEHKGNDKGAGSGAADGSIDNVNVGVVTSVKDKVPGRNGSEGETSAGEITVGSKAREVDGPMK